MSYGPFKDQIKSHKIRYYTETENFTVKYYAIFYIFHILYDG